MHARKLTSVLVLVAAVALGGSALTACTSSTAESYAGRVSDDSVRVEVPTLQVPVPDINAWSADAVQGTASGAGTAGADGASGSASGAGVSASGSQAGGTLMQAVTSLGKRSRVTSMPVAEGDTVRAGQVVAVLDDSLLRASVASARAAASRSRSDVGVIDQRLADIADAKTTLASKRSDVVSAISRLQRTRADLVSKRAEAVATLAQLEKIPLPPPGTPPSALPPGSPDPNAIRANIAKLRAGIAQMDAGIAKIDAGLAKARSGLAKMDSARVNLNDARDQLSGLTGVADAAANALEAAVGVAEARLEMATLRSPVDGVVIQAASIGSVLAPGAAAVTVRPSSARSVTLWLSPRQLESVSLGDAATVRLDALRDALPGRVTRIGSAAAFPPTSQATQEIHLTRATEVEITLDTDEPIPAGVPVDVAILTR